MSIEHDQEIISSRAIAAPVEVLYRAFSDPDLLTKWWGPQGFTNTFHEFDLRPGGRWKLTMHGPEKGNYENASVFTVVEPNARIAWKRQTQPLFEMEVLFRKQSDTTSEIVFRMLFESPEGCNKLRNFVVPNNEENFDRLEEVIGELRK